MSLSDEKASQNELKEICERITQLRRSLSGIEGEVLKAANPERYLEKQRALAQSEMARFCLVYGRGARFP